LIRSKLICRDDVIISIFFNGFYYGQIDMAYLATICAGEKEKEILFLQTKRYEKCHLYPFKCQASSRDGNFFRFCS